MRGEPLLRWGNSANRADASSVAQAELDGLHQQHDDGQGEVRPEHQHRRPPPARPHRPAQEGQGRFTHGPRTSRSLQSSSRKTVAEGSSTPASAWTDVVMSPSGAPGMSTMPAANSTMRPKLA